jgi:hypothetical protein
MPLSSFCDASQLQQLATVVSDLSKDYVKIKNITPEIAYEQIANDIDFPQQQRSTFIEWAKEQQLFEQQALSEKKRQAEKAIERVLSGKKKNVKPLSFREKLATAVSNIDLSGKPDDIKKAYIEAVSKLSLSDDEMAQVKSGDIDFLINKAVISKKEIAANKAIENGLKQKPPSTITAKSNIDRAVENVVNSTLSSKQKQAYLKKVTKVDIPLSEIEKLQPGDGKTIAALIAKNKDAIKAQAEIEARLKPRKPKEPKTFAEKLSKALQTIDKAGADSDTAKAFLSKVANLDLTENDIAEIRKNNSEYIEARKKAESKLSKFKEKLSSTSVEPKKMKSFVERLWQAQTDATLSTQPEDIQQAYLSSVSGIEVTDVDRVLISQAAKKIETYDPASSERARLTQDLLDKLARKYPVSWFSRFISMNYSGMISSPFTFINNAVAGVKVKFNTKLASISQGAALYKYLSDSFSFQNESIREAMSVQGRYALAFDTNRKSNQVLDNPRKPNFEAIAKQNALKDATAKDLFGFLTKPLPEKWKNAPLGKVFQSVFDIQNATDIYISTQTDYYYMGRLLYEDLAKKNPNWSDKQIFEAMDERIHIKNPEAVERAKKTVQGDPKYPFFKNPQNKMEKDANLIHAKRVQDLLLNGFTYIDQKGAETTYRGIDSELQQDAAYLTDLGLLKRSTEIRDPHTGEVRNDLSGRLIGFTYSIDKSIDKLMDDESMAIRIGGGALKFVKTQILPFARTTINFIDRKGDYIPVFSNVKAARYAKKRGGSALKGYLLNADFDLAREQVEFQDRKLKAIKGLATFTLGLTSLALLSPGDDEEERKDQGTWVMITGNGTGLPKGSFQTEMLAKYGRNKIIIGNGNDMNSFVSVPYGNDQMGLVLNMASTIHNIFKYQSPSEKSKKESMKDDEISDFEKSIELTAYMTGAIGQEMFQGSFNTTMLRTFDNMQKVATKQQTIAQFTQELAISQGQFVSNVVPYANAWRTMESVVADGEKVNKYYKDMAWALLPFTRAMNKSRPAMDFFARPITQIPSESTNLIASMVSDGKKQLRLGNESEQNIRQWMSDNRSVPTLNPTSSQIQYTILPGSKDLKGKVNDSGELKVRTMPEESKYEVSVRTGLLCRMLFTDADVVKELKTAKNREDATKLISKIYSTSLQIAKYDMLNSKGIGVEGRTMKFDQKIGSLIINRYLPKLPQELSTWQKENNVSF